MLRTDDRSSRTEMVFHGTEHIHPEKIEIPFLRPFPNRAALHFSVLIALFDPRHAMAASDRMQYNYNNRKIL